MFLNIAYITFRENGFYILTGLILNFWGFVPVLSLSQIFGKSQTFVKSVFPIHIRTTHVSVMHHFITHTTAGLLSDYKITSPDFIANLRLNETRCKSFLDYDKRILPPFLSAQYVF